MTETGPGRIMATLSAPGLPPWDDPPAEFAIITAYASTGETSTSLENESADKQLEADLRRRRCWMQRLTGYSPATGHAEPGWAVELDFDTACDLGLRFRQDAILRHRRLSARQSLQ